MKSPRKSTARRLLVALFLCLVAIQGAYVFQMGNRPGVLTDGFSEANALRAADAYLKDGLSSFHGLPRQAYGTRFSDCGFRAAILEKDGTIQPEMRRCLAPGYADPNRWVYTHYPEGSDVLLAVMGRFLGLDNLRLLRLFPLGLCLLAVAVFFTTLARAFGTGQAVWVALGCLLLPMFHTYLPGLHFQGYSFALFLLQMSLLMHLYWLRTDVPKWTWVALFLFGFLQGWLSFDQFFVVGLIAWPLWLLRKSEGVVRPKFQLLLFLALPIAGFGLAHFLHLLQVAGETGGLQPAIMEFRTTATERAGAVAGTDIIPDIFKKPVFRTILQSSEHSPYLRSLTLASYQYLRDCLHPLCFQFFPSLPLAVALLLPVLLVGSMRIAVARKKCTLSWPEAGSPLPALGASLVVSLLWLLVMAGHCVGNHHVTVRHFFVFYFFVVLVLAKSVRIDRVGP